MKNIFVTRFPWQPVSLWLAASNDGLVGIVFDRAASFDAFTASFSQANIIKERNEILKSLGAQLQAYFAGGPIIFDIPLDFLTGTPFQRAVWQAVKAIPYGKLKTYGQIAQELGKPGAARAVGAANGANPTPIVVPCHRVVQSDGKLGGYSGGLDIKDKLLRMEGVTL